MRTRSRTSSRRPARRRTARPGPAAWLAENERLYRDFVVANLHGSGRATGLGDIEVLSRK